MTKCVGCFAVLLAIGTSAVRIVAAPPQISRFEPIALMPGKTGELILQGQNLGDARRLWTTFASRCDFVPAPDASAKTGEKLICHVTVPRGEHVGIGALRVVTGEGVSNPILVMLDDLPTIAASSDNHTPEQAQSIQWPIAIDGQCDAVQEDFFRIHAAAGQRVSFEVVAQRLGSKLDSVVRLLTTDGKEVARLDDAEGAGGDSRFIHTFTADGDYLLALGDVRHAGGGEFRYRLRMGTFPLVTSAYPAGGHSGAVMSFELRGVDVDSFSPLNVALPVVTSSPRIVSFDVPSSPGAGSGWFQVEANPGNETIEQEPNDVPAEPTAAQVPGVLNGRLDKPDDRDYFKFSAHKGQHLSCVAKTRELGSACDLFMSLHKVDGAQIAVARQEQQTVLDTDIPADGEYLLRVEDLAVGGLPGYSYRVDISDSYSGFRLNTEYAQYSSPQGGTFVAKVLAQRRGYDGPIELAVEGLGEGVTLEGNKLEGGETLLKITLPANIGQGELRHAKIVGKAKVGEHTVSAAANQRDVLSAMFPNVLSFPAELENTVAIGVGAPFPPFFNLSLAGNQAYFPQLVGASTFDVDIERTNEAFKDPIAIAIEGLPEGVTAEVAPVDNGLKAVRVSLKGPRDLAERELPIRIVGTGQFQEQTRRLVLENIALRIIKPLVVSVAMTGPIIAGGQQEAEVNVVRFGDDQQPVRVQVADGPAGLSAPIFVTIPANANQVKIPFTAAPTAPPGKFENLVLVASTTVQGQNVTVQSKAASVEIQPPSAK